MTFHDIVKQEDIVFEDTFFFAIFDKHPVSPGHMLIISKRVTCNFFELSIEEQTALPVAIVEARRRIEEKGKPDGYNIGMNCGEHAGQTIFHFHCHVIPRYKGDTENPRGGVRHCIPGKGWY